MTVAREETSGQSSVGMPDSDRVDAVAEAGADRAGPSCSGGTLDVVQGGRSDERPDGASS
jgi:hypothetical protein